MKTVTLIRHGKPEFYDRISLKSFIRGADIQNFIEDYNCCDLATTSVPQSLEDLVKGDGYFISSSLKRARDSFRLIDVKKFEVSEMFVEAELPFGILKNLKMPLFLWLFLLRTIWFFGYAKNCESLQDFKKRMERANTYVNEKLEQNDNVLIMAHGFVNMFLKKMFLKDNWVKVKCENQGKFLSYSKYERKIYSR